MRDKCRILKEDRVQEGKTPGDATLVKPFSPGRRSNDVEFDVHIRLQCEKVSHAKDARINRRCVFHLEGTPDRPALEP
jgi:hypothetical protein